MRMNKAISVLCCFVVLFLLASCKTFGAGNESLPFIEYSDNSSQDSSEQSNSVDTYLEGSSLAIKRRYVAQFRERIIVYGRLIAAEKDDGTLLYTEEHLEENGFAGQEDRLDALHDVIALKPYDSFSGKKKDSTMFTCWYSSSKNENVFKNVSTWTDVVDWSAQQYLIIGLKNDGTVVTDGVLKLVAMHDNPKDWVDYDLSHWNDVVSVACCGLGSAVFGLKSDGTVYYATASKGYIEDGRYDSVLTWKDIVQLSSSRRNIAGLRSDGGVEVTGFGIDTYNSYLNNAAYWKDIISIAVGNNGIAGLKADGTVVYAGDDTKGQEACLEWEDIIAIAMGDEYVVGLREDGAVLSTSAKELTAGWNIFKNRG